MEKKRPILLTLLSILIFLGGFFCIFLSMVQFPDSIDGGVFYLLLGVLNIGIGKGLLALKKWARLAEIGQLAFLLSVIVWAAAAAVWETRGSGEKSGVEIAVVYAAVLGSVIFYLTRPSVKEWFKSN